MGDQPPLDDKIIFASARDLAKYLDIRERRLRQYKQGGRLNYTTDAVLVDRTDLRKIKESIAAWAAPYVPHRFRSTGGRNRKALSRYSGNEKAGHRCAGSRSLDITTRRKFQNNAAAEPSCNQRSDQAKQRIRELMRSYGLSREEALEVLKKEARR